jgi:hypothetical protein
MQHQQLRNQLILGPAQRLTMKIGGVHYGKLRENLGKKSGKMGWTWDFTEVWPVENVGWTRKIYRINGIIMMHLGYIAGEVGISWGFTNCLEDQVVRVTVGLVQVLLRSQGGMISSENHIPWRIHGAAIYGAPWIPSIFPSHISIYTSTMDPSWVWDM